MNNFNRSKPVVSVRVLPNQFKRYKNKFSNLQPIYKRESLSFLPQSDFNWPALVLSRGNINNDWAGRCQPCVPEICHQMVKFYGCLTILMVTLKWP